MLRIAIVTSITILLTACQSPSQTQSTRVAPTCSWGSPSQAELNALLSSLPDDAIKDACLQYYQVSTKGLYMKKSGDYESLAPSERSQISYIADTPPKIQEEKLIREEIQPIRIQLTQ